MSFNKSCSLLHFSKNEIIDKAHNLGVSLRSNEKEIAKSVNDLLDLEVERASKIIRNTVAIKPMSDADMKNLGISSLESFCMTSCLLWKLRLR